MLGQLPCGSVGRGIEEAEPQAHGVPGQGEHPAELASTEDADGFRVSGFGFRISGHLEPISKPL
jgi:hypothetical protein